MTKEVWKENPRTLRVYNLETGKSKTVILASDKQLDLIFSLEQELGLRHKDHSHKTVWACTNLINKLKAKTRQSRLL